MRYRINYDVLKKLDKKSVLPNVYNLVVKNLYPNFDTAKVIDYVKTNGKLDKGFKLISGENINIIRKEANRILRVLEAKKSGTVKTNQIRLSMFTTLDKKKKVCLMSPEEILVKLNDLFVNKYPIEDYAIIIEVMQNFLYGVNKKDRCALYRYYFRVYRNLITRFEKSLKINLKKLN